MHKNTIVLHADMGAAIIKRLSEFTPLPNEGTVAGQAVASAVSELFGDGRAVAYNDVDVFREQTRAEYDAIVSRFSNEEMPKTRAVKTCDFSEVVFTDSYRYVGMNTMTRYRVLHSRRVGMLNDVVCSDHRALDHAFLGTFDMNAVQVGVDLATQKLFWTPAFAAFCQTRQLEIVKLHTPAHSLVRYFKKRQELEGVYGNDERMLEMVSAACAYAETHPSGTRYYARGFGRLVREKMQTVEAAILPYFNVETALDENYPVHYLRPRHQVDADLAVTQMRDLVHVLPHKSRALREKYTPGKTARLHYLAQEAKENSLTRTRWLEQGDAYVQGNVTPAQIKQMDKLVTEHRISTWLVAPTLAEQWQRFSFLRGLARTRGVWVYGVLETQQLEQWTEENVCTMLDAQERLLQETLTTALLPPLQFKHYQMRELVTGMELITEGVELHHCVGGYAKEVKDGTSRIVAMRPIGSTHASQWMTMELRAQKTGTWSMAQLYGLKNRDSTPEEQEAAQWYTAMANAMVRLPRPLSLPLVRHMPTLARTIGVWCTPKSKEPKKSALHVYLQCVSLRCAMWKKLPYVVRVPRRQGGTAIVTPNMIGRYWFGILMRYHKQPPAACSIAGLEDGDDIPF